MDSAPPRPAFRVLATLLALVACAAVFSTAATVIVSSRAALPGVTDGADGVASLRALPAYRRLAAAEAARALVDSLVAPLGALPDDSTVRGLLSSFAPRARAELAPVPIIPDSMPWPGARRIARLPLLDSTNAPDTATLRERAADTLTPWLPLWRRFARMTPYADGWYPASFRARLAANQPWDARPHALYDDLRFLNALAASIALRDGRPDVAAERLRENIGAYRHLLTSPLVTDWWRAARAIGADAERLARVLASVGTDDAARRDAERARRVASIFRGAYANVPALTAAAVRASAAPSAVAVWELTDDEKLPFAVRAEVLLADLGGGCANRREILFGFDARRRQRVTERTDAMAQAIGLADGRWMRAYTPGDGLLGRSPWTEDFMPTGEPSAYDRLATLLPPGPRGRVRFCESVAAGR